MKKRSTAIDNRTEMVAKLIRYIGLDEANWKRNKGLRMNHKYLGYVENSKCK